MGAVRFRFSNLVNGVGGKSFVYDARVSRETTRLGWIQSGQSIIVPTAGTAAGSATDLRREASVIIDLVARERSWRSGASWRIDMGHGSPWSNTSAVIETCTQSGSRIGTRAIPGWYELSWVQVARPKLVPVASRAVADARRSGPSRRQCRTHAPTSGQIAPSSGLEVIRSTRDGAGNHFGASDESYQCSFAARSPLLTCRQILCGPSICCDRGTRRAGCADRCLSLLPGLVALCAARSAPRSRDVRAPRMMPTRQ